MSAFHKTPLVTTLCACAAISLVAMGLASAQQAKPAAATAGSTGGVTVLGQYGDWGAYSASPGGKKICFALAKPASGETNPPNRRNDTMSVYLFVSSRPSEKVKDEVSLLVNGYVFKEKVEATAQVGNATFAMYTQKDGAWIKNVAEEVRLVEAMRKSGDMTVKAMTDRGTETIDRFSLKGMEQALTRVTQECK